MTTKVEAPRWKLLSVASAKGATYNPESRTERRKLRALINSMADLGQLYPILFGPDNVVIDGHRRLAAARHLEWESIQAIVTDHDADSVYASVNLTAEKMNGNNQLAVWLARQAAVSPRQAKLFREMAENLGLPLVRKIADAGLSSRVYQTARRVVRYCGLPDTGDALKQAVKWLVEVAVIGQVMKAMERGVSPTTIRKAINTHKPLSADAS